MTSNEGWAEAATLIGAALGGDRNAMTRFVQLTQRDVWRFLASHTNPRDADDLTQETLIRVLRTLPRFERRSSLRTWMLVIARRVVIDHLRHQAVRPRLVDVDDWTSVADRTLHAAAADERPGTADDLTTLLRSVSPERREALFLTQLMGMSYAEAADVCGCPVGTIRSRVARGREDLARLIDAGDGRDGLASAW